jgi:hypothetical protein
VAPESPILAGPSTKRAIIGDMTEYNDQERQTLRTAAFGAIYLVASAEPGFVDMIKESLAGSKALAKTSPELRDLFKSGGIPQIPKGSPSDVESTVLSALSQSTSILEAKGGPELDGFRAAITSAVDQVASAAGDTSAKELAAAGKVKAALGVA